LKISGNKRQFIEYLQSLKVKDQGQGRAVNMIKFIRHNDSIQYIKKQN